MNEIRAIYGKKMDKKNSHKKAMEYYKSGKITVDDFNELALEGVLGAEVRTSLLNIQKGLWKK